MTNKNYKMKKKQILLIGALSVFALNANAQVEETLEPVKDTITILQEQIDANSIKIKGLEKLKVSGYIQAQAEIGQVGATAKTGANSGAYSPSIDGKDAGTFSRFGIRRGRIKFQYSEQKGKAVFQLDITEKGLGVKNAYFQYDFSNMFSLLAGINDRPFGDEISYSSNLRESPERSLIFQKLFPDERDLGGQLTINAPKNTMLEGLKLDAGFFSGNGIRVDDNAKLDFIGHLKYDHATSNIAYGIGASMYLGTTNNADTNLYTVENGKWGKEKVEANNTNVRRYIGFDGQFSIETLMGITNIRAEYLFGKQPSTSGDFGSPKSNTYDITKPFSYLRKFSGGHVYLVQDIYRSPFALVLKYCYIDPNTELKGDEITNKTDLAMSSFGFGGLWRINSALRLQAFYEINTNENTKNISGYSKDVNDNMFTLRLQYKF
jgi:phosphate-selective porin